MILTIIDPIAKGLGEWSQDNSNIYNILFKIVLAVIIGTIIGCERSSKRHAAGLRTFILTLLATTIVMMLDIFVGEEYGVGLYVLSAGAVIGIAILSSNSTLYTSRSQIKGLTTSVALWASGIIGLTLGAGFFTVTLISFIALLLSLSLFPKIEIYLKNRSNHFEIHLELKNAKYLQEFVTTIRELGLKIDDIESNPAYGNSGLSVYSISVSIFSKELKQYKTHSEIISALKSLEYVSHIEEMK